MVYIDHKYDWSWQNSNMSSSSQLYTKLEHKSTAQLKQDLSSFSFPDNRCELVPSPDDPQVTGLLESTKDMNIQDNRVVHCAARFEEAHIELLQIVIQSKTLPPRRKPSTVLIFVI